MPNANPRPGAFDLFSFDKMLSTTFLAVIHGLLQAILLVGAVAKISGLVVHSTFTASLIGISVYLVSAITLRVFYESAMVLFRIYEEIRLARQHLETIAQAYTPPPAPSAPPPDWSDTITPHGSATRVLTKADLDRIH